MKEGIAPSGGDLSLAGVLAGLTAVAVLAGIRFVWGESEPPLMALGGVALLVGYAGPFLVSAVALGVPRNDVRAGVWLGAGSIAAILSVVSAISLVSLLLLPGAALLIAAGVRAAAWDSGAAGRVAAVAVGVAVVAAVSGVAWLTMSEAHCWYRAGDVWVQRPFSDTISISSEDPFTMGVCGSGPTPAGVAVSMGAWAAAVASVAAARGWRSGAPRPA